ncbi:hypothetical protein A2Y83_02055 [Candidatus Falkowbacteria bacterium RBG_13_39_14]|uniref:Fibronectin type-III domain-containing protein n=1 Tax=Candidatus Falkowbacteria bacterium RBG_13_39_14 TaxID=1797985 RepID=A0A1F5S6B8_9BACT|nr:MAG: hypothetical protein A2Y83_02055 [Candidatus Falkowbacteria bacterium RBG_13_39_14]
MSEEKLKLSQRAVTLITAYSLTVAGVLVMAVSTLSYAFILKPKYDSVTSSINLAKQDMEENIEIGKKLLSRLKKNSEELAGVDQQNLNRLAEISPQSLDIAGVISVLNAISENSGFVLEDIKYFEENEKEDNKSASSERGKIKVANLLVTISGGGYDELKSFLEMASDSVRIIDVTSVSFDGSRTYNLELLVYYIEDKTPAVVENFSDLDRSIFNRKSFLRLRQYAAPVLAESIDAVADNESIPPPISDLVINDPGTGDRLNLFWENAPSDNAGKIKIYRFEGESVKGRLVAELDKNSTAFTDAGIIAGKSYYYLVKTASPKNIESANNRKYPGIPTNIVPPLAPHNVKAASSGTIMELSWTNPACYDLAYIYIYKSATEDILGELATKIPAYAGEKQSWEDKAIENFVKYYYTLVAEDAAGNRSPDKVVRFSDGDLFEIKER